MIKRPFRGFLRFQITRDHFSDGRDIHIRAVMEQENPVTEADSYFALNMEFVQKDKYAAMDYDDQTVLGISKQEAQHLFDGLWSQGFRPQEGYGGPDVIQAKNDHISDLRRIMDKFLGRTDA